MKPVRELMKDPKVAIGLAALALLFVAYRATHMGGRPTAPGRAGKGTPAAVPGRDNGVPAPAPAVAPPFGPDSAASDNGASAALPKGDVAWNWERNPFIGPPRKGAGTPAAEPSFPTIIVPGFGPKAPSAAPRQAEPPVVAPPAKSAEKAAEALPELQGTVVSGGSGLAVFGSRLVPVGGTVSGWTVEQVTAYDVTVSKGGDRRTIGLSRLGSPEGKGGKP